MKWSQSKSSTPATTTTTTIPNVYLTNDPSNPQSLIVEELQLPFPSPSPFTPEPLQSSTPPEVQPSVKRPNKLRKPPPPKPCNIPNPALPPHSFQIINSRPVSSANPDVPPPQPYIYPDSATTSNANPFSPSPTATTESVRSYAPLLSPDTPIASATSYPQVPTPARKLTKRRRATSAVKSTYVKLLNDQPIATSSAGFPTSSASSQSLSPDSANVRRDPDQPPTPLTPNSNADNCSWSPISVKLARPTRRESVPGPSLYRGRNSRDHSPYERQLGRRTVSESRYGNMETGDNDVTHDFLPPVRTASPFCVNIPIHQKWHERRAIFLPSTPPSLSKDTADPLSSFAWTGVTGLSPSSIPSSAFAPPGMNKSAWRSTWSIGEQYDTVQVTDLPSIRVYPESTSPIRPNPGDLHYRPRPLRGGDPRKRWTLTSAITDDGITDEVLVKGLEDLRRDTVPPSASPETSKLSEDDRDVHGEPQTQRHSQSISPPALTGQDVAIWHTARRALLICRELVRTERHYLGELRVLLGDGGEGTSTTPPALMLSYIPSLVRASEGLLGRMTDDPSAWGVAAAFLGSEDELEEAFRGWCKVVGDFFAEQKGDGRARRRSTVSTENVTKPRRRSMTSFGSPGVSDGAPVARSRSRVLTRKRASVTEKEMEERNRRPAVRDLAILPTQRVTRYVLLYRDLLEHTPLSSPSRALVDRALEAALRIARNCDAAQGNAEFWLN